MRALVLGATGIVGGYIVDQLAASGFRPYALSRHAHRPQSGVEWIEGDLETPVDLALPDCDVVFSTVHPNLSAKWIKRSTAPVRRIIQFTSTSIDTKLGTGTPLERSTLRALADGETKLIDRCNEKQIRWTILRPTIIYAEGRDANISKIGGLAKRFGIIPLAGEGSGLRQPVHAADLATGAIAAAATSLTENRLYVLSGTEIITYREMVGRVFDGLGRPRRIIHIPTIIWRIGYRLFGRLLPGTNVAMASRMAHDMIFDCSPAVRDFNWAPRPFRPIFDFKDEQAHL